MVPLFIYSRIADHFVMPAQAGMTNKKISDSLPYCGCDFTDQHSNQVLGFTPQMFVHQPHHFVQ